MAKLEKILNVKVFCSVLFRVFISVKHPIIVVLVGQKKLGSNRKKDVTYFLVGST